MTDYTISCKLSNETVYAYYRGRFWHWNGSIWKESRIMTHRFELARVADKKLTPQEFLTNGAEFAPLDEYEIDCVMLDALENAKPCRNAPIEPVEEESECAPAQNADAAVTTAENADHLGERGGCKRISPRCVPANLRIGPLRIGGRFFCVSAIDSITGQTPGFHPGGQVPGV